MAQSLRRFGLTMLVFVAMALLAGRMWPAMGRAIASTTNSGAIPVATETLIFDHVHFGVPDPAKAVEWYSKYMDGQPGPSGEPNERLLFGKTRLIFLKTENPRPSADSVVDYIGFSFRDVDAKVKELEAAGARIVTPVHMDAGRRMKVGFIEDPWGTKIEVMQDPALLGFHYVHVRAPDPVAVMNWYLDMFGGERVKVNGTDALKYGDVWILLQKGDSTPSEGHSIDHLGWRTATDLDAKAAELKSKGVKFSADPRPLRDIRVSFVDGPAGIKIELLKR